MEFNLRSRATQREAEARGGPGATLLSNTFDALSYRQITVGETEVTCGAPHTRPPTHPVHARTRTHTHNTRTRTHAHSLAHSRTHPARS